MIENMFFADLSDPFIKSLYKASEIIAQNLSAIFFSLGHGFIRVNKSKLRTNVIEQLSIIQYLPR